MQVTNSLQKKKKATAIVKYAGKDIHVVGTKAFLSSLFYLEHPEHVQPFAPTRLRFATLTTFQRPYLFWKHIVFITME